MLGGISDIRWRYDTTLEHYMHLGTFFLQNHVLRQGDQVTFYKFFDRSVSNGYYFVPKCVKKQPADTDPNRRNPERDKLWELADVVQNLVHDKADDDSISLQQLIGKEALQAATTFHNFVPQYEKKTPQLLGAIRRFKHDNNADLKFNKKQ
ncbi:hypothetical protein OROMI_011085 [Orobanche minor]